LKAKLRTWMHKAGPWSHLAGSERADLPELIFDLLVEAGELES